VETAQRNDIRNIAVIAHVDHGKTTLVDGMLCQSGLLGRGGEALDRVLDSVDLERERGITILAKNTAIKYLDTTINILDTPGHHDFGGEVERTLLMADAVLLLVDAAEGPLPQTRFVLEKALRLGLPPLVAINKIDRKDARPGEVLDEVYDLFIDLGASDELIEFPVLYTNGRAGIAHRELDDGSTDLRPLFEMILDKVPPPADRRGEPLQMHVNNLGWDDYVGRLIIGRIHAGSVHEGQMVKVLGDGGAETEGKVMRLYGFSGLKREEIQEAGAGDIAALAGIETVAIGDTVCSTAGAPTLPRVKVDEPTLSMDFCVNTSPFAGQDGKYITSRHLRERLRREAMMNVAIRVEDTAATDVFRVVGRGELQLGIFVETMRREGYEVALSRPTVVIRRDGERKMEPTERLLIDVPESMVGVVTERMGPRKGRLQEMLPSADRTRMVFTIPTRGLIGWGSEFMNITRGQGVMNTSFEGWIPWQGPIPARRTGALVSDREGVTTPYALFHLQPRGTLFLPGGTRVYKGMVVGEHAKSNNLDINVCRPKKLTNMRAAGKDDNVILTPHRQFTLEQAMEFIAEDELIEVTPKVIRLRKRVLSGRHVSRMGEE